MWEIKLRRKNLETKLRKNKICKGPKWDFCHLSNHWHLTTLVFFFFFVLDIWQLWLKPLIMLLCFREQFYQRKDEEEKKLEREREKVHAVNLSLANILSDLINKHLFCFNYTIMSSTRTTDYYYHYYYFCLISWFLGTIKES